MTIFSRIFGKNEKRAVGVDIGTSAIKIVELYTESGHVYLETYGSVALGPYSDFEVGKATGLSVEKIQEALRKVLEESACTADNVAATVPFSASLISVIRLPKVSENRLEQIVPTEARKYVPAPIEEVTLDWSVIDAKPGAPVDNDPEKEAEKEKDNEEGEDKEGESNKKKAEQIDVLLAVIHNYSLERQQKILSGLDMNVMFFEIEVFSTLRALSPIGGDEPVAVIDIGAATSQIYITEGGITRSSHVINMGSQDITISISNALNISQEEAEMVKRAIGAGGSYIHLQEAVQNSLSYLYSEALRFIGSYEKKNQCTVDKVILSGGGASMKGLQKTSQDQLGKEVSIARPFDRVKSLPFMKETLNRIGPEYAPALGAALRAIGVEES
ncbi:MAG: pilus assembly protein PilM [Patescibacteria group bacterium]